MTEVPREPRVESESEKAAIDATKEALLRFLRHEHPRSVFYLGQLEVLFEDLPIVHGKRGMKGPFHWITSKAVSQLVAEGRIASEPPAPTPAGVRRKLHLFHARAYRDWRREAREMEELVEAFSESEFARGMGHLLELLVDSALASVCGGFEVGARDVNEWNGRKWTKTNEDLDRIYVSRQGVVYGCEVKNTLPYIERGEFENKLAMCRLLGVRPLFVARMMPESYIDAVWKAGGFSWVLKNQYYPLGSRALAAKVRGKLGLPVICSQSIPDGDLQRFENGHKALVARRGK